MKELWNRTFSGRSIFGLERSRTTNTRCQEILFHISSWHWELEHGNSKLAEPHLHNIGECLFLLQTQTLPYQLVHYCNLIDNLLEDPKEIRIKAIENSFKIIKDLIRQCPDRWRLSFRKTLNQINACFSSGDFESAKKHLKLFRNQITFFSSTQAVYRLRKRIQNLLKDHHEVSSQEKKLIKEIESWAKKNLGEN